jgi:hypothetical protein
MSEKRNAYRLLVGKPKGKGALGRPSHMWVDNIKIDLGETGWDSMDWIDLAQDGDQALVNTIINLLVPLNRQKFLSSCRTGGLSRRAQLRGVSQSIESINCLFRGIYSLHLKAPKHLLTLNGLQSVMSQIQCSS